ncbi:hypothetical protein H8E07_03755 [bacterium]|nr:hypothetical protein [bacterium]
MRLLPLLLASSLLFIVAPGCSSEDPKPAIGDHCATNTDCPDKCQTGGGFPNGICTKACGADATCPSGWHCISKSSGICLRACTASSECAATFGDSWVCDDEALQEGSGDVKVCIGK